MRVILQVTSGPQAGRKLLLGPHRELKVGRSQWAELACEDDDKMSRVHFKLETNAYGCSVEDLGSSNGTFVNEEPVTEVTVLHEGDQLRAGGTQFHIHIEGGSTEEAVTINQENLAAVHALREERQSAYVLAARDSVLKGEQKLGYVVERLASDLHVFTPADPPGEQAAAAAARLAMLLQTSCSLCMIVHPLQAPQFPVEDYPTAEPIFDWFPEEVRRERSPLLVPAEAIEDLPHLLEITWGLNALVVLVITSEVSQFLSQLREALRPEGGESLMGICWPNVLDGLLTKGDGHLLESRLSDVHAVLLEDAQHDNAWKLIAEEGFADVLAGLGLEESEVAQ